MKEYALFHSQFCKSISALSRLLHIDKNFVKKFRVGAIFQSSNIQLLYPFKKKIAVQNVTAWLVQIWTLDI